MWLWQATYLLFNNSQLQRDHQNIRGLKKKKKKIVKKKIAVSASRNQDTTKKK